MEGMMDPLPAAHAGVNGDKLKAATTIGNDETSIATDAAIDNDKHNKARDMARRRQERLKHFQQVALRQAPLAKKQQQEHLQQLNRAFYQAVEGGKVHLIKYGLDTLPAIPVNALNDRQDAGRLEGETPLHAATRQGVVEIIRLLLQNDRIDGSVCNTDGLTAFDVAVRDLSNPSTTDLVRHVEILLLFVHTIERRNVGEEAIIRQKHNDHHVAKLVRILQDMERVPSANDILNAVRLGNYEVLQVLLLLLTESNGGDVASIVPQEATMEANDRGFCRIVDLLAAHKKRVSWLGNILCCMKFCVFPRPSLMRLFINKPWWLAKKEKIGKAIALKKGKVCNVKVLGDTEDEQGSVSTKDTSGGGHHYFTTTQTWTDKSSIREEGSWCIVGEADSSCRQYGPGKDNETDQNCDDLANTSRSPSRNNQGHASDDTLYSILFCREAPLDAEAWFEQMIPTVRNAFAGKIFYTAVKAANKMGILTCQQCEQFLRRGLVACSKHCVSDRDKLSLETIFWQASKDNILDQETVTKWENTMSFSGFVLVNDGKQQSVALTESARQELELCKVPGIDGAPENIRHLLRTSCRTARKMLQCDRLEEAARLKFHVLVALMGVVVNLFLDDASDKVFGGFISAAVNLLDSQHLEDLMADDDDGPLADKLKAWDNGVLSVPAGRGPGMVKERKAMSDRFYLLGSLVPMLDETDWLLHGVYVKECLASPSPCDAPRGVDGLPVALPWPAPPPRVVACQAHVENMGLVVVDGIVASSASNPKDDASCGGNRARTSV